MLKLLAIPWHSNFRADPLVFCMRFPYKSPTSNRNQLTTDHLSKNGNIESGYDVEIATNSIIVNMVFGKIDRTDFKPLYKAH